MRFAETYQYSPQRHRKSDVKRMRCGNFFENFQGIENEKLKCIILNSSSGCLQNDFKIHELKLLECKDTATWYLTHFRKNNAGVRAGAGVRRGQSERSLDCHQERPAPGNTAVYPS